MARAANEALKFEFGRQRHDAINKHQEASYLHPISASQPDQTTGAALARLQSIERLQATVQELNALMIKRVIGLPGEEISARDGVFYINCRPRSEPYVRFQDRFNIGSGRIALRTAINPEGHSNSLLFLRAAGKSEPVKIPAGRVARSEATIPLTELVAAIDKIDCQGLL